MNIGNRNSILGRLSRAARRRERKARLKNEYEKMQMPRIPKVSEAIVLGNLPGFYKNFEVEKLLQQYTRLNKGNSLFYIEIVRREKEPQPVVDAIIKFVIKAHTLLALEKLQECKSRGYYVLYQEERPKNPSPFECGFNSRYRNYLKQIQGSQRLAKVCPEQNETIFENIAKVVLQSSKFDSDTIALQIDNALEEILKSSIDETSINENSADAAVDAANKTENVFEKNSEDSNDSTSTIIIKQEQLDFNETITLISHELSNNDKTVKIKQEPMNTIDPVPHKLNEVDHSEPQFSEMDVNYNAINEILDNFDPSEIELKQEPMETNDSGQAEVELPVEKSINKNEEDLTSLVSNDKSPVSDNAINEKFDNFDPSEIELKQEPMVTHDSNQAEVESPIEKSINKNDEDLTCLVSNDKSPVSDNAINEKLDNFDPSEIELKQEPMETNDSGQAEVELPVERSINKKEKDLTSLVSNVKSPVSDNAINENIDNFGPSEIELQQEPMETHDSNQAEVELPIEKSINKNDEDLTSSMSNDISLVSDNAIKKILDNFDTSEIELQQKSMETNDSYQADVDLPIEKSANKNEEDLTSSVSIDMSLTSTDKNNIDAMTAEPTNKVLETYFFKNKQIKRRSHRAGRKNARALIRRREYLTKNKMITEITDSRSATIPQETSLNNTTSIENNCSGSFLNQLSSDIDKAPASETSLSSMDTINEITRSTNIDKIAVNLNSDVAKELNDTAKDTEIDESYNNYTDYKAHIKNLPILNRPRTIHLLKDKLLPRVLKKTAIDCVQIYVLQDEIERRPLGEALIKFGIRPYLYAQQTCKLDGVEVLNNKIQVELVRGQNILKNHIKAQLTRKRKREDSSESSEDDESPVAMPSEHKADITEMDIFKRRYLNEVRNLEDYGFRPEFLQELGLKRPLSNAIIVKELHPKVDEAKLHEVFSLAGEIKNLKFSEEERKARIEYDHPVEAVQAIHIFHKQRLFDEDLKIHMDVAFHQRPLPIGLSGINKGLARNGEPLKGVRAIMELKNIHETLYELGKMIKYESIDNGDPFSTWYGERTKNDAFATSTNINNISNNSSKVSLTSKDIQPAVKNITSNTRESNQNNSQSSDSDSNVIDALGTILVARGLIPTGTDCKDPKNIISALQINHVNHCGTTSMNHQNINIPSQLKQPNLKSPKVIPNVTNTATGKNNLTKNVPSQSIDTKKSRTNDTSPNVIPNVTNTATGPNNLTMNMPSQLSNMYMPLNGTPTNVISYLTNTATSTNNPTMNLPPQLSNMDMPPNGTSPNVVPNLTNTTGTNNPTMNVPSQLSNMPPNVTSQNVIPNVTNTVTGKNNLTKNVSSQSIDTKKSRTNDTSPNVIPSVTNTATGPNNLTMNMPSQLSNMYMPPNGTSTNVIPYLTNTATSTNNPTMNLPLQLSNMDVPPNGTSPNVVPNLTNTTGTNNPTMNVPSQLSIMPPKVKSQNVIPNVTNTATGKNNLTKKVPTQSINKKKKKKSRKILNIPPQKSRKISLNIPPQLSNMYMPPNCTYPNLIQNVTNTPRIHHLMDIHFGYIPVPPPVVQATIWDKANLNHKSDDRNRKFPRDPRVDKVPDTGSGSSEQNEGTKRLIFKNLPPSVTQEELTKKMREVGDVLYCVVAQGSALVAFNSLKDADRCLQDYFIGRRWMVKLSR